MPIYKDEHTNKYYYSVRYKDAYGNNKRKVKRGFKTKREAKASEAEFITGIESGYSDTNTYDYIFNHYLKHTDLREKTIMRKKSEYKKHVKDKFGNIKMSDIKQSQCQEFRTYLMENINSPNSARTIWAGFKVVINYAMKHFGLRADPTLSISPIKRIKPKPKYMLRQEFEDNIARIKDKDYREILTVMFYTGLRVGECMALTWSDYNRYKKEISINKTMDTGNRKIYGRAKTESSEDVVPLPKFITEMLNERYEKEQKKHKYFDDSYFIFGGTEPRHYNGLNKKYKEVFPNYSIHTLRHSYASYLANNGVDMFVLQSLMRHSRITETMETYSHLYTQKKHDAIRIFDFDEK